MLYLRCLFLFVAVVVINGHQKPYENHVVVSVDPWKDEHFRLLEKLENQKKIDIWNDIHRNSSVHVMFDRLNSTWLFQLFDSLNLNPQVMISDVQKLLDDENRMLRIQARSASARSVRDKFFTYDEMATWLLQMVQTYPNLATLTSIGKTYQNRDIWLIKLSANVGGKKKKAFLDFGIHAREWISPATGLYIIDELLSNYARRSDAKAMLDQWEFHIVPVLNPDGYAYSHTDSSTRLWRKNRKPVGGNCFGVDLNRNFGFQWNTGGSSASPCSDTFHGGSAMSENEAKAMQNYMTNKEWDTYLTFHSYGQYWFTNWGYTTALPSDIDVLKAKAKIGADALRAVNGRVYTIGSSAALLYIASGGSEDWTRGSLNIKYSYCLELPPTGGTGFIAPVSEIKKTGAETYAGVVAYLNSI